ncbi:hypothetical protein C8Q80DRAFT_441663 [Daedaleopsis nitida]|nr:hypothetical protein C8Q80DRAFT_441663 [Daedaleopsis nitida]
MATGTGGFPPIHDLPNEILVNIFQMHNVGYSSLGHKHRPHARYASRWYPLMLVCRHWRDMALVTPTLWQSFDVHNNTAWLQLAVDRSRNAALELYFHNREVAIDSIPLIVAQAPRLRKLLLPPLQRSDFRAVETLFRTTMPVLNELRVHLEPSWKDFTPPHWISVDSFDACFPSLHSIRFENMAVPWTLPALSRMRYLALRNCTALNNDLTFDQFLDVLEGCAELEDIRLHGFLSTIAHRVPVGFTRVVDLPRLQKVTVSEPAALCRQLLSAVHLPPTIILRVFGEIDQDLDPNDDDVQSLFASMFPEDLSKLPVIRSLKYATVDCAGDGIKFSLCSASHFSRNPGSIMLQLFWKQDMEVYIPRALEEFISLFSPAPLEDVHISCTPDSVRDTDTWTLIFAALPRVHTLTVLPAQLLEPVWDALAGRHLPLLQVDEDAARAFAPVLLPCLRTLQMEYLEWDEDAMGYILESMRRRKMRGLPKLDELSIAFFAPTDGVEQVQEEELDRILPFYEESMEEFAERFVWSWT